MLVEKLPPEGNYANYCCKILSGLSLLFMIGVVNEVVLKWLNLLLPEEIRKPADVHKAIN